MVNLDELTEQYSLVEPEKVNLSGLDAPGAHTYFAKKSGKHKEDLKPLGTAEWVEELFKEACFILKKYRKESEIYIYWPKPELDQRPEACGKYVSPTTWPESFFQSEKRQGHITFDKIQYFTLDYLRQHLNDSYNYYIKSRHVPCNQTNGIGPGQEIYTQIICAKDDYTMEHSYRVYQLVSHLLEAFRCDFTTEMDISSLKMAALLHDFGKIATPDALLWKPGDLTDRETYWVNRHPLTGIGLLCSSQFYSEHMFLLPIISHHLYPEHIYKISDQYFALGLPSKGTTATGVRQDPHSGIKLQYHLGTTLIKIADALDARISRRPYKGSEDPDSVIKSLHDNIINNDEKPKRYQFPIHQLPMGTIKKLADNLLESSEKIKAIFNSIPFPS